MPCLRRCSPGQPTGMDSQEISVSIPLCHLLDKAWALVSKEYLMSDISNWATSSRCATIASGARSPLQAPIHVRKPCRPSHSRMTGLLSKDCHSILSNGRTSPLAMITPPMLMIHLIVESSPSSFLLASSCPHTAFNLLFPYIYVAGHLTYFPLHDLIVYLFSMIVVLSFHKFYTFAITTKELGKIAGWLNMAFVFSYITGKYRQRDLSSRIYGILNTRPKGTTWVWQGQAVYEKKKRESGRFIFVGGISPPPLFSFVYIALYPCSLGKVW